MGGVTINPIPVTPYRPEQQDSAGDFVRLKSLVGQQELQQQQIQGGQLENQQRQLQVQQGQKELDDQKKITDAYLQSNGDLTKTADLAAKSGVSLGSVMKIKAAEFDTKQKYATLTKDQQENIKRTTEMIGQHSQAILALPPEQRPAALQQSISTLAQAGAVPPDQAQQLLQSAPISDPQGLETWLKVHGIAATSAKDQIEQIQKQQDEAETKRHNQAIEGQPTEARLAERAVAGDTQAEAALKRLDKSKREGRPVTNLMTGTDAKDIADAIENGDQPPTLQGLYRNAGPVRAELARRGVPLAQMETDWKATQKYIGTLNGTQQVRLRQAISTASDSLDKIEGLYKEFQQIAPTSGIKLINKVTLATAKQLPGRPGAVATALDAQIADLTSELGNVYMGGNSPTDHSLSLAAKNLSSDWNKQTFEEALKQTRANITIRQNSITHAMPAGLSGSSNYMPSQQGGGEQTKGGGTPVYAKNPKTGERVMTSDGGKTWTPAQ